MKSSKLLKKKYHRFSIIPDYIKKDKRLSSTDKLLYGEIFSLAQKKGYCFAANFHFELLYNLGKSQVSKTIQKLKSLDYIKCEYGRGNSRKIYIIEKPVIFFGENHQKSEPEDDIQDVDLYDSDAIGLESESYDDSVTEDDIQDVDLCDLNTIALTPESHNNKKKIDTNKKRINNEEEKRSTKVLRLSFSNKDQLESIVLEALSGIYNRYRIYNIDGIIFSIDESLEIENCKENIFRLGFTTLIYCFSIPPKTIFPIPKKVHRLQKIIFKFHSKKQTPHPLKSWKDGEGFKLFERGSF
jgi:hypothetical protein